MCNVKPLHILNLCWAVPTQGRALSTNLFSFGLDGTKDVLPTQFVEFFTNLGDNNVLRAIKQKYKKTAVIYLWYNKTSGKTYVGRTVNLLRRLENYLSPSYVNRTKISMAICGALSKYGINNFDLYILEIVPLDKIGTLHVREVYWATMVNPSYNLAPILDQFVGNNHPRFGKPVTEEVSAKISASLTGRKLSEVHCQNMSHGHKKKMIYCYDYYTGQSVVEFVGMRPMCRVLNMTSTTQIWRKLDTGKPIRCVYQGVKVTWLLYSKAIVN